MQHRESNFGMERVPGQHAPGHCSVDLQTEKRPHRADRNQLAQAWVSCSGVERMRMRMHRPARWLKAWHWLLGSVQRSAEREPEWVGTPLAGQCRHGFLPDRRAGKSFM